MILEAHVTEKNDPYNLFSDETLRRADEMCANLGLEIQVDRRGRSTLYSGALSYLNDPIWDHQDITVAEYEENPWLTLISKRPLDAGRRVLLVYRRSLAEDVKLIGKLSDSEHGRRRGEEADYFITRFDVVRDR